MGEVSEPGGLERVSEWSWGCVTCNNSSWHRRMCEGGGGNPGCMPAWRLRSLNYRAAKL